MKIANLLSGVPTTAIAGRVQVGLPCESVPVTPGAVHVPGEPAGFGMVIRANLNSPRLLGSSVPNSTVVSVLACFIFSRMSFVNAPPHIPEADGGVSQPVTEPVNAAIWVGATQSATQVAEPVVTFGS